MLEKGKLIQKLLFKHLGMSHISKTNGVCSLALWNGTDFYCFVNTDGEPQKKVRWRLLLPTFHHKPLPVEILQTFYTWMKLSGMPLGQQSTPPRSCLKVRNSAQRQGLPHSPSETRVSPERDPGTLIQGRWVTPLPRSFGGAGTCALINNPSQLQVQTENWLLQPCEAKKGVERTNFQIYGGNGVSEDKRKPKLSMNRQYFSKKDDFESFTTSSRCYLWQRLHPQIFRLRNFLFCRIITKCGQSSRLGILLLASTEPTFNFGFLFTPEWIPFWFLQKTHFKEIALGFWASHALTPPLSHIPGDMPKDKRQVMLLQHWSYLCAAWPVADISCINWMLSKRASKTEYLCFPTTGDTNLGFSFIATVWFS